MLLQNPARPCRLPSLVAALLWLSYRRRSNQMPHAVRRVVYATGKRVCD
jgi:hypothetical protein